MVHGTRSRRDLWEGQVATLVFSSSMLRSHVPVAPPWSCLFHLTAGVCEPLTCYMATKLSAWQDGAALILMDLRVPCSEGLATADPECASGSMEHPAK